MRQARRGAARQSTPLRAFWILANALGVSAPPNP